MNRSPANRRDAVRGEGIHDFGLGWNDWHSMPELSNTTWEGILADLKPRALQPYGRWRSQVI